ncbi:MAG: zinc-dependent metalloprotease [Candidatus Nanopelagicales bacterium]
MSNVPFGFTPGEPPDDSEPKGGQPGEPFNMADLGAALSQLGAMLQGMSTSQETGPVDWPAATDMARKAISAAGDPVVADAQRRSVEEAVRLADLWLDPTTAFPSSGAGARAWSRSEWLTATMPAWQEIITPIAEQVQTSMGGMMPSPEDLAKGLPPEMRAMLPAEMPVDLTAMLGPLMGMAKKMGATMFAAQTGQGLAALAGEVLGATDVGIPLTSDGVPTLVPQNMADFGMGLGIEEGEIAVYLALREVAHQRLFRHVPWLGPTLRDAVAEYARGIGLDASAMEEALRGIDMSNPANLQEALASGVLAPKDTPEQKAALARLETLLALVEGWVDHVVTAAAGDRLGTSARLREAVRRRRAVGGPAEKTFASLVGLEMRPRRMREAAALWSELEKARGVAGRDEVWAHPDLLPGPSDLDDPAAFVTGSPISDADLAALASGEVPGGGAGASEAGGAAGPDEAGPDEAGGSGASEGPDPRG